MPELFVKVLTSNDDSGRHGLLIPEAAYTFFPRLEIPDEDENATDFFEASFKGRTLKVSWKYYQRYPERRVTRLPTDINTGGPHRLIVFKRTIRSDGRYDFEIEIANNVASFERLTAEHFGPNGISPEPGSFVRYSSESIANRVSDPALQTLLSRYDAISDRWHISQRSGPTGVGYTFETLMGVAENNDKEADFLGIELKAKLQKEGGAEGKTNLFQQSPKWEIKRSQRELIRAIGMRGHDGLWSCFSAVTIKPNNLGLVLFPRDPASRIRLRKNQEPIGFWPYATLEKRLLEKHNRAVFVEARRSTTKGLVSYNYNQLVYCERPTIENFVGLIDSGDILFEFTMSEKPDGKIRNHGYPWRLKSQTALSQLFGTQVKLRG